MACILQEVLSLDGIVLDSSTFRSSLNELLHEVGDASTDRDHMVRTISKIHYKGNASKTESAKRVRLVLDQIIADIKVPLTEEQKTLKDLLNMKYGISDRNISDFIIKKLTINVSAKGMREMHERFGTIFLRSLSQSDRPKLIIGCGDRTQVLAFNVNTHGADDTIDPNLENNPSILGLFTSNNKFIPDNHYKVIFDESPLFRVGEADWEEIERILQPGGFFVTEYYPWLIREDIPANSQLKILSICNYRGACSVNHSNHRDPKRKFTWDKNHPGFESTKRHFFNKEVPSWTKKLGKTFATVIIAKALNDGSYPTDIRPEDFPNGIRFEDQDPISRSN